MAITSDRDKVRLAIGDTDVADPLLTDAEINVQVANWPDNVELAAANCAEAIAAKYAREFNFRTDLQQFDRSQRVDHYTALAGQLRSRGGLFAIPLLSASGTAYTVPASGSVSA